MSILEILTRRMVVDLNPLRRHYLDEIHAADLPRREFFYGNE